MHKLKRLFAISVGLWLMLLAVAGWRSGMAWAQTRGLKVLHSFELNGDGYWPYAGVIRDEAGNLYGTTTQGGEFGHGSVFTVDSNGAEALLWSFGDGMDGAVPIGGVIQDPAGNFYGTTSEGGEYGYGTVFRVNASGGEAVLFSFAGGTDGSDPQGGVIRDPAGNLYGTTNTGGDYGYGTVFRLDPSNNETVLYSFAGGSDGRSPTSGLIRDGEGNLYGATFWGGDTSCEPIGCGVVFELGASGSYTLLHTFVGGSDGALPNGVLARDSAGNLYGTTTKGGSSHYGILFKLDPQTNETILHTFTDSVDGTNPNAGVLVDRAGNLYCTAAYGGINDDGTVIWLDAAGNLMGHYDFTGAGGAFPYGGVTLDDSGTLYGTTYQGGAFNLGTVFEVSTR